MDGGAPGSSEGSCFCLRLPGLLASELRQHRRLFPLAVAQMLLLADQPLLSTNMSTVAHEFGLKGPERDEMLGGIVSIVFFTSGALFSLVAGRLADLMKRTTLVSICMLVGACGTLANSRAPNFSSLLFCRAAVGAAVGGLLPASFAIIGDMYPAEERPHAIAMLAVISGMGPAIGQGLAGFLGATAGWRAPFALVGAAGLGITLLLFVLQKEPNKIEEADLDEPSNYCTSLCSALARPTVILTCLQGIFGCVPWAVIGTFLADFLATNANMGVPGATTVLFSFGVGCFTGTAIGGKLGQHLYRRDKRLQAWLMGLTVWGGMLPFMFLFSSAGSWGHPVLFYILALAGGILAPIAGSNAKAVLLNTVATRSRGTVFGVYNIMDDLGKGLGPALVSSWVRRLGRRDSFMLGIAFWAPCGLFCVLMTKTITSDDLSARTLPEVPSREAIKFEDESPETAEGSFEGSSLTSQSSTKSKSPDSPSKLTSKRAQTIGHPYRETLSFSDDNS